MTKAALQQRAFSLIEIMVTVALLSVIILGLVAMFDQTRKAFTSGLTQTDYLEAGRTAADMIARELGQITPAYTNLENFYVDLPPASTLIQQSLADPTDFRTNGLQELYFLTRNNVQWSSIGYRVDQSGVIAGVGTLYRYYAPIVTMGNSGNMSQMLTIFLAQPYNTNRASIMVTNRVIDGVVDFRIRAYDRNGTLITNSFNGSYGVAVPYNSPIHSGDYLYRFRSNTVPAYVELELGVLETKALQLYKGLPTNNPTVGLSFLATHAGQVHIFRQRIPVRSVDPSAYPFPQ